MPTKAQLQEIIEGLREVNVNLCDENTQLIKEAKELELKYSTSIKAYNDQSRVNAKLEERIKDLYDDQQRMRWLERGITDIFMRQN